MTMMALTRKRHRAAHLWALATGLLLVGLVAVGVHGRGASAIAEGDVQFSVTQSPAGGSIVQVGSDVTFDVTATVTNAPIALPVHFEFDYPDGLTFVNGQSNPAGVMCVDNTPGLGKVRCSYGLVGVGPRLPVSMLFHITASTATAPAQVMVVAGDSDGGPDTAVDGTDDTFATAGTLTTFGPATIAAAGSPDPASVYEGKSLTYMATITNNSAAATGLFAGSILFTNATVTNIVCSSGTGGGLGGANAACNGAGLAPTETLTITAALIAANTANGSDIAATVAAPALGISQPAAGVTVDELGLDFTGSTRTVGTAINICTGAVPADIADDAAAGLGQTGTNAVVGATSQNPLLNTSDFQVSGPGAGAVTAATGCGANQSGVNFTPSAGGTYTVSVLYNTGGTNSLVLTVSGGPANNPAPTAASLAPSAANAGGSGFTLTVTGTGFINGVTVVRWNGSALTTNALGATSVEALVPAGNIATAGSANVTVFNPAPGGGESAPLVFTINAAPNPIPVISGISPNSTAAGSPQFVMTVTGTNFVANSVVRWDATSLVTTYGSPTSLTATVPATLVTAAGAANVTVLNPAPGGGTAVTPQTFTITPGATKLAFTTQPGAGVAGSPLAAQPVVAVQSASNATISGDSSTVVTLALNGAGTLSCTGGLSKTVTAGVASFAGCSVSAAGTGFTITASASGLTSATSGTFDVTAAPPTASNEITVSNPTNAPIARSRLRFAVSTGNLAASAVNFIIKRDTDGKYWNMTAGEWQQALVLNAAAHGTGSAWTLAIEGEARREFADTVVTLEVRATVGTTVYRNGTIPELTIR